MDEKAEFLQRRLALLRNYLRQGVDATLAQDYLRQIREDQIALDALYKGGTEKPDRC